MSASIIAITILPNSGPNITIDYMSLEYCYIVEDIFSLCTTGKISFVDRTGLMEKNGICGNERVVINYGNIGTGSGTNDAPKHNTITMSIFKIDNVSPTKRGNLFNDTLVELTLVDLNYGLWTNSKWYKGWGGTTPSTPISIMTIVSDIVTNIVGSTLSPSPLSTEKILTTLTQFDMHSRSAAECVKWLLDRSSSDVGNYGYLLYRSSAKYKYEYVLTTLEKLLQNPEYMGPYNELGMALYVFDTSNVGNKNKIRDFNIKKPDYNVLKSILGGNVVGFDSHTKSFINKKYTYKDAISKFTMLGRYTLFPNTLADSMDVGVNIVLDGTDSTLVADNLWYGNWIKEYCNQNIVEIFVDGHEDRYAGGKIRIDWPSSILPSSDAPDLKVETMNRMYSGQYLVSSVTQYFGPRVQKGWMQKLTLIKNGYGDISNNMLMTPSVKQVI